MEAEAGGDSVILLKCIDNEGLEDILTVGTIYEAIQSRCDPDLWSVGLGVSPIDIKKSRFEVVKP